MVTVFGGKKIVWICFEGGRLNFTSCCCALCVCGDFWIRYQVEEFFILNKYMSDPYILIQVHGFASLSLILYFFLFRLYSNSLYAIYTSQRQRITSRKICSQFFLLALSLSLFVLPSSLILRESSSFTVYKSKCKKKYRKLDALITLYLFSILEHIFLCFIKQPCPVGATTLKHTCFVSFSININIIYSPFYGLL